MAKMQLNDAAKGLLHHDDIATSLMVNSGMGFKRYNLSNFEVPSINVEGDVVNILNSIRDDRYVRQVLPKLCSFNWTVTAIMDETKSKELDERLKKDLSSSCNAL